MSNANTEGLTANTLQAFKFLQQRAAKDGIELKIASGFRSIERQTKIWQRKNAPDYVFDVAGTKKKASELTDQQWLNCVMEWSAIPGLSRHHWGTDIDVYDAAALPANYQIQLTPEEYQPGGPFEKLGRWLSFYVDEQRTEGFFRPYRTFRGGVQPEAWHLSYKADADLALDRLIAQAPRDVIPLAEIRGGAAIANQLDSIIQRYVVDVDQ